jgi:hypothetical protein
MFVGIQHLPTIQGICVTKRSVQTDSDLLLCAMAAGVPDSSAGISVGPACCKVSYSASLALAKFEVWLPLCFTLSFFERAYGCFNSVDLACGYSPY